MVLSVFDLLLLLNDLVYGYYCCPVLGSSILKGIYSNVVFQCRNSNISLLHDICVKQLHFLYNANILVEPQY